MNGVLRMMVGLAAALALLGASTAGAAGESLGVARKAIDEGRLEEAIGLLRARLADAANAEDAHARYLLGQALFNRTDAELTQRREQQIQRKDLLEPHQVEALRECLALANRAVEIAPGAQFAPDAAFLAAKVQDWGYLRRYEEAQKYYQVVVDRYPGTEAASKANARLEYWRNLWKHNLK